MDQIHNHNHALVRKACKKISREATWIATDLISTKFGESNKRLSNLKNAIEELHYALNVPDLSSGKGVAPK